MVTPRVDGRGLPDARRLDPDGTTAHLVERLARADGDDDTTLATGHPSGQFPRNPRNRTIGGILVALLLVGLIVVAAMPGEVQWLNESRTQR